jgi:hypothetical protein
VVVVTEVVVTGVVVTGVVVTGVVVTGVVVTGVVVIGVVALVVVTRVVALVVEDHSCHCRDCDGMGTVADTRCTVNAQIKPAYTNMVDTVRIGIDQGDELRGIGKGNEAYCNTEKSAIYISKSSYRRRVY